MNNTRFEVPVEFRLVTLMGTMPRVWIKNDGIDTWILLLVTLSGNTIAVPKFTITPETKPFPDIVKVNVGAPVAMEFGERPVIEGADTTDASATLNVSTPETPPPG